MKTNSCPPAQFISFEGVDGCGKSTLMDKLSQWLEGVGIPHIRTREPGGTPLGEKIRDLLLDPAHAEMNEETEVLLYTASRAQLAAQIISPALKEGKWVLSDRYIDATLAYQGYGRGMDLQALRRIQDWATKGLWPHRTVLLDCDIQVAFQRMQGREGELDRMEQEKESFHQKVREGYLELAKGEPQRFIVLNAANPLDQVLEEFRKKFWEPLSRKMQERRP
ncbi:MAG: dTMP kinase [Deltaproteobacteria bacterium]|jgi:dTMP kinase|nr:dTMP kinase [Deltaproteobacteria bacterium]